MISSKLENSFKLTHFIIHPGTSHAISFKHNNPSHPSFTIFNVFLPSGSATWSKIDAISAFVTIEATERLLEGLQSDTSTATPEHTPRKVLS